MVYPARGPVGGATGVESVRHRHHVHAWKSPLDGDATGSGAHHRHLRRGGSTRLKRRAGIDDDYPSRRRQSTVLSAGGRLRIRLDVYECRQQGSTATIYVPETNVASTTDRWATSPPTTTEIWRIRTRPRRSLTLWATRSSTPRTTTTGNACVSGDVAISRRGPRPNGTRCQATRRRPITRLATRLRRPIRATTRRRTHSPTPRTGSRDLDDQRPQCRNVLQLRRARRLVTTTNPDGTSIKTSTVPTVSLPHVGQRDELRLRLGRVTRASFRIRTTK